jgi:hypothetical protein
MTDNAQFSSPAAAQNSINQGQVAPTPVVQSPSVTPGAFPQVQGGQPAPGQQQVATPPSGPSAEELQRQLEQERQLRLQRDQQVQQFQQGFTQLQAAASAQERERKLQERMNVMLAAASNMTPDESNRYIAQQTQALIAERDREAQYALEQERQQSQQMIRQAAIPEYVNHLVSSVGLSERGREKLLALGDPEQMYKMAQIYKADEDYMQQQIAQLQGGQVQNLRSQEVLAMQNAGLGAVGGQNTGTFQVEIPDDMDPDERAMLIYDYQKYGPGYQPGR